MAHSCQGHVTCNLLQCQDDSVSHALCHYPLAQSCLTHAQTYTQAVTGAQDKRSSLQGTRCVWNSRLLTSTKCLPNMPVNSLNSSSAICRTSPTHTDCQLTSGDALQMSCRPALCMAAVKMTLQLLHMT